MVSLQTAQKGVPLERPQSIDKNHLLEAYIRFDCSGVRNPCPFIFFVQQA